MAQSWPWGSQTTGKKKKKRVNQDGTTQFAFVEVDEQNSEQYTKQNSEDFL